MLLFFKFIAVFYLAETLAQDVRYICSDNEIIDDEYVYIKGLGAGKHGIVVETVDRKGNKKAIKINDRTDKVIKASANELRVVNDLRELKHTSEHFLIHIFETFIFRGHECIAFEMVGPSVADVVDKNGPLSLPNLRFITYQVCVATKFLHKNHIIHEDINAGNILLADPNFNPNTTITRNYLVRLTDFGASEFDYECKDAQLKKAKDVQFIGLTILQLYDDKSYHMLLSASSESNKENYLYIMEGAMDLLPNNADLHDFVQRLLKYDASERMTLEQALKHKFLNEIVPARL